jgi:DNA-directed RNA polymerase subunit RPC12/RpoP
MKVILENCKYIECPNCGHHQDHWYIETQHCSDNGQAQVTCFHCDIKFIVKKHITVTYDTIKFGG